MMMTMTVIMTRPVTISRTITISTEPTIAKKEKENSHDISREAAKDQCASDA